MKELSNSTLNMLVGTLLLIVFIYIKMHPENIYFIFPYSGNAVLFNLLDLVSSEQVQCDVVFVMAATGPHV